MSFFSYAAKYFSSAWLQPLKNFSLEPHPDHSPGGDDDDV